MSLEQENSASNGESINKEVFSPRHFYAAYIYDHPQELETDISQLIELALLKQYPVRYWWLSEAIAVEDNPDSLIICVHHEESDENAGMDFYEALGERGVKWDMLEAAAMHEYLLLGKAIEDVTKLLYPDGKPLFPEAIPSFLHVSKHTGTAAAMLVLSDQRMSKLPMEARLQMQATLELMSHAFLLLLGHSEEFEGKGYPIHESFELFNTRLKEMTRFFESIIGYEPPEIPY